MKVAHLFEAKAVAPDWAQQIEAKWRSLADEFGFKLRRKDTPVPDKKGGPRVTFGGMLMNQEGKHLFPLERRVELMRKEVGRFLIDLAKQGHEVSILGIERYYDWAGVERAPRFIHADDTVGRIAALLDSTFYLPSDHGRNGRPKDAFFFYFTVADKPAQPIPPGEKPRTLRVVRKTA